MSIRRPVFILAVVLPVVCSDPAARADRIVLTNGRVISGQVLDDRDEDTVTIEVPYGTLKILKRTIASIERESPVAYYIQQGNRFLRRKLYDRALTQFRKGVKADPTHAAARGRIRDTYMELGRHHEAARRLFAARGAFLKAMRAVPWDLEVAGAIARLDVRIRQALKLADEAKRLIAAHRPEEGLKVFEMSLEMVSDLLPRIAEPMAQAYVARGDAALRGRRVEEAAGYYDSALEFHPVLAQRLEPRIVPAKLAVVRHDIQEGEFEHAELLLSELLAFAPTNAYVRYYMGRYLQIRGAVQEAAMHFARGLRRQIAGKVTAGRLMTLRTDLEKELGIDESIVEMEAAAREIQQWAQALDGDWLRHETARFRIHHHNHELARLVGETAEYHYQRIVQALGFAGRKVWEGKCDIFLHRNQKEYTTATGQPAWSGGVSRIDARGRSLARQHIASFQTCPRLLKSVIPHELTHVIFGAVIRYGRKYPPALHEGIAVLMEPVFRRRYYDRLWTNRRKWGGAMSAEDLLTRKTYPEDTDLFYAESGSLVAFLVSAHGMETFVAFSRDVERMGVVGAMRRHYGYGSYEALQLAWLRSIQQSRKAG